jgi:predicted N-acetyltransferase YhbS
MRILPLAETPHLAEVARRLHGQWWAADGWSLEATEAWLRAATGPAAPCTFVAEIEGRAVGTATLDTDDLPHRLDLSPWLASVLVWPEFRGRGIAGALVAHVEAAAQALGHPRLWLFTPDAAAFYAARGWAPAGEETWHGRRVALMVRELGQASRHAPAP